MGILRSGEPCPHRGCLAHISHPCEGCGRIGGQGEVVYPPENLWKIYDANEVPDEGQ